MTNIEKSAFKPGEYVGYGGGKVWRIVKGYKSWWAYTDHNRHFYQPTLRQLNIVLRGLELLT